MQPPDMKEIREAIKLFQQRVDNFVRAEKFAALTSEQIEHKRAFNTALSILKAYERGELIWKAILNRGKR